MPRPKGSKNRNPKRLWDRFWAKVDKKSPDECWEWLAYIHPSGYGTIMINKKMRFAHRISWVLSGKLLPSSLCVLHKCDNRKCVNPNHLFLGTKQDNAIDMVIKGRGKLPDNRGENHGMSKLTSLDVLLIRSEFDKGILNMTELGNLFGVDRRTIGKIVHRESWRHV